MAFGSVEAAREYLIEKEIETVLRKSHAEQFDWLENKFGLPLKKGLDVWPAFIEVTERRNLFVHTSGLVSRQYLDVCAKHKVTLPKDATLGNELGVSKEYFTVAHEAIFEVGVKLAHVLWRKLKPEDREEADDNLSDLTLSSSPRSGINSPAFSSILRRILSRSPHLTPSAHCHYKPRASL